MQHAGLQYGQGAVNSHQSPPFAHADISHTNGGNTTSSLRQFRKKDDKTSGTDLNTSVESSHIARVPPHNHYPARPNDYLRYQHQYPDYNSHYKETPAPVKYSEIAETPPQHVDLQKHKEVPKDFMDMCNITQQTHMKQNYADNLTRQQSYPPDAAPVHPQYLHKEPQVHPGYKPESQYQQYPQLPKYNMPSQCRKYPPPPPPENDFLAKLQRINPSMARSIMSDHHLRESHSTYPPMDQNRMYPQNHQRYYPQNYNYQPYNYPSSCSYPRTNQMAMGGAQYPTLNPHSDRSISPRNLHMMNYGTSPQKVSPNYPQYNTPEYAQHYQHRRTSLPQEYYQQTCRTNPYMGSHQIPPEPTDNRGASGAIRQFLENWAEEEAAAEITFKENVRVHNESTNDNNQQVYVINPSELPQCLENVSLVPTENGQFIIKTGALDNSVVRIKETTENNGERTVNLQILEATAKPDCMLEEAEKTEETPAVPYQETQSKDCDATKATEEPVKDTDESSTETSVIVSNEVSVIKDMPLIDEEHAKNEEKKEEETPTPEPEEPNKDEIEDTQLLEETNITSTTKRTQRIFSVDDIMNNIGTSPTESRRNSLQFVPKGTDDTNEETEGNEEMEYRNAISVEDDTVILEIGGAWVQLNINQQNGTKVLSVLPLSDSLVIDVNSNYQESREREESTADTETVNEDSEEKSEDVVETTSKESVLPTEESVIPTEETVPPTEERVSPTEEIIPPTEETVPLTREIVPLTKETVIDEELLDNDPEEQLKEISDSVFQSEVVIGEESLDNDVFLDFSALTSPEKEEPILNLDLNIEDKMTCDEKEEEESKVTNVELEETTKSASVEEKREQPEEQPIPKLGEGEQKLEEPQKSGEEEKEKEEETIKPKVTEDCKTETANKSKDLEEKRKEQKEEKVTDTDRKREDRKRSRDGEERKKSSSTKRVRSDERKDSEERSKSRKIDNIKKNQNIEADLGEDLRKKEFTEDIKKKKHDKKSEENARKKENLEECARLKKQEQKLTPQISIEDELKKSEETKLKKSEKKLGAPVTPSEEIKVTFDDPPKKKQEKKVALGKTTEESTVDCVKPMKKEKKIEDKEKKETIDVTKPAKREKRSQSHKEDHKEDHKNEELKQTDECVKKEDETEKLTPVSQDEEKSNEDKDGVKTERSLESHDVIQLAEEMITLKQMEETKEVDKLPTKAAKKLYLTDPIQMKEIKPTVEEPPKKKGASKLEETVNKIKSMKEKEKTDKVKKTSIVDKSKMKSSKKVTFNLETEVREIGEEIDRKRLSLEEYNSRKRKNPPIHIEETKIMEDTVTSTEDEVVETCEEPPVAECRPPSPPKRVLSNWEADTPSPGSPKDEVMSTTNRKCIIDANEFNIKPIESVSTPSPVSSSQFSYHSEDDSLQVYKDVVDSKLNSLNIKIPKLSKPKPVDRFSVLLDRFLNKGTLNYEELEEVKKFIELKRKMMEEEKKLTYEVKERDYKDLKLHFRKVPEKRKKKRFRNLYAEDSSDDSDSSRSDKGVENYSVYQRDSQGVPKLIFKRKSGLPQPFVKLERSQAVELLAKKRKLY